MNVVATTFDKSKENTVLEGPWQVQATEEEFAEAFSGWEEEFQALIKVYSSPVFIPVLLNALLLVHQKSNEMGVA